MTKHVASVKFTKSEMKTVRSAARKLGISLSAFVAEAAAAKAAEVQRVCPTCKREHRAA